VWFYAYDLIGIALVALFAAWNIVSTLARAGNPLPEVVLFTAATIAYIIGRLQGRRRPMFVAAALVVSILVAQWPAGRMRCPAERWLHRLVMATPTVRCSPLV